MKFIQKRFSNTTQKENQPELKILSLSGSEGATKNMTVYECGDDIIIVDTGIGFPTDEMQGVEAIIPDFTYVIENQHKVKGLFVTHAHEDHFGAVPFLLKELNMPIYANKLVQEFIKGKIVDRGTKEMLAGVSFNLISPETDEITLGNFKISAFRVNHSVPTSLGLSIQTPQGRILHMADYKVDWSPVLDKPIDIATISKYGEEGVLCLLSDCLGANTEGYSKSERTMKDTFHNMYEEAEGRQIMITTISSNISRMYQIIDAAIKAGRKIVLGGRSIKQSVRIARELDFLPFADDVFIDDEKCNAYPQKDLVYLVAGCFGQPGSSLDKISRGEHNTIRLEENAMVIFSADPNPPGVQVAVERVMDNLTLRGAEVVYSKIQANLHVSGHGPKGDLTIIASIVKPKYFIPIGGSVTQTRSYKNMVEELGFDKNTVFELLEGGSVIFRNGIGEKGETITTKQVYIDGKGFSDLEPIVIKDREVLSNDGVFVVIVPIDKATKKIMSGVEIVTRGFVYVKESKELMARSKDLLNKVLKKHEALDSNWGKVQNKLERDIERFLFKETGRRPMIIVQTISV